MERKEKQPNGALLLSHVYKLYPLRRKRQSLVIFYNQEFLDMEPEHYMYTIKTSLQDSEIWTVTDFLNQLSLLGKYNAYLTYLMLALHLLTITTAKIVKYRINKK